MSDFRHISAEQAEGLLAREETVMLLDMRDARAYCQGHDPRAIHLSDTTLRSLVKYTPRTVHMIVCGDEDSGSQEMARFFSDYGFVNSYSVDGGYAAWSARRQRGTGAQRAALRLAVHG
ncbi:rhodanese-like domain-containing protein [Pseudomonas oryzae]|uniref:Thiosulfate sulfurtransferase n=1 Tax=Pseudomonas oryzae TaxID=1392877 RepID=A0A1H1UHK6_9PSED|nr:rhodanese-like domain-containing protein [Pseudomonas oryzae]SDS72002.1 thiosulfate sulfurtransferase [Pseudomonas oryzae]